jgi:polyphosphate glucokinase
MTPQNILVVDIGGTHVKLLASGQETRRKFVSGPTLKPSVAVRKILEMTEDWQFDAVAIGYPAFVFRGKAVCEPANLAGGWVGFDFAEAFGRPVRMINDAAMQALGSYEGGSMLFLGLGTGLGSAMVVDGELIPMELAHLIYKKGRSFEEYLGLKGLERLGKRKWREYVEEITAQLSSILGAEYVILGGGNAQLLKRLPANARLGNNYHAFEGGFRLWKNPPSNLHIAGASESDTKSANGDSPD